MHQVNNMKSEDLERLAKAAQVDTTTALRWLAQVPVRPASAAALDKAARELGLTPRRREVMALSHAAGSVQA